jgi:hypothetical protein
VFEYLRGRQTYIIRGYQVRKRHLAGAAVLGLSIAAVSQLPASAAVGQPGILLHQVIGAQQSGWAMPAGSYDLGVGSITAMPNGSSQLVAVNTDGNALEHNIRNANGTWQGWRTVSQQSGESLQDASIAGMPNGSSQLIEVTANGGLEHNVRNANGTWQPQGWGSPAGSTGIIHAEITALPNGSSEVLAVTTANTLELNTRSANGAWQGWSEISQPVGIANADIVGMPNGSSQLIEVTSNGELEHNVRNANGTWQPQGWTTPSIPPGTNSPIGTQQAAIAALPNGSSEIFVAAETETVFAIRNANGNWSSAWGQLDANPKFSAGVEVSAAGMPNGTIQAVEIAFAAQAQ